MGVYNCAGTLPEALDSLMSQTYRGFKIIMCDDRSTDGTYSVAQRYAEKYDNIILLKNDRNLKLAATLNRCLEYADTEYVARMDGDDISLPGRFEKEINFLDHHPEYGFVSTAMIYFDESGDWGVGRPTEKPTKNDFTKGSPFCHAPCMVRASAFQAVGGYTDRPSLERLEDYYLWYKFYVNGFSGFNLTEPLYKMRDDKSAMLRRKFRHRIEGFKINLEVFRGLDLPYPYLYATLHFLKAFIPRFIMRLTRKILMSNLISK